MSVEKWNKWVAKIEGYVYRNWLFKLTGLAVILIGYWDMKAYPDDNVMVFSLLLGIPLLIADWKES